MTETKNKNGKSGVYQNSDLGVSGMCHKIPDQVGDDGLIVGSACSKIPAFAGMTERNAGTSSNPSFSGSTRESSNAHNEMLGVLAVAGVLSIGGVAGYRYAIDKMNANDIINEVKKRAVTASQQRILGHDINLSEYGDNGRIKGIHAVTATNDYVGDKKFFALTVSNVPQRVCDEILKQDWKMPVEMAVGEFIVEDDTVCDVGDNEMLFAFHNTLDSSMVPGEGNGEENGDDEVDDGDDPWAQECGTNEYHDFNTGECVVDDKCTNDGEFWYEDPWGGSCVACPDADNPVAGHGYSYMGTCTKCPGAKEGSTTCGYYCVYCPDGVTCGDQCCGEEEKCQYSSGTYTCVSALEEGECMTNDDCEDNQYCQNDYGCEVTVGTCTDISSTPVEINGTTYTASTDYMPYHAAENFCDALGKKLAPVTDGCTAEELAATDDYHSGSCSGWAHTTGERYWTSTKISGCASYSVSSTSSGSIWAYGWTHGYSPDLYALCR